jgi:hypothetical protein
MALILARLRETEMLRTPVGGGNRRGRGDAAKSRNIWNGAPRSMKMGNIVSPWRQRAASYPDSFMTRLAAHAATPWR